MFLGQQQLQGRNSAPPECALRMPTTRGEIEEQGEEVAPTINTNAGNKSMSVK